MNIRIEEYRKLTDGSREVVDLVSYPARHLKKAAASYGPTQAEQYTKYLREQYASVEGKQRKLSEIFSRDVLTREGPET